MNMEVKKPLVSICIPTNNRKTHLKKCIESLIKQTMFEKGIVEIVVSDNASTDGTKELCELYSEKYSNFIYQRQNKSIDWHINFLTVLKYGKGTLRKLSNDTLMFTKDSLDILCDMTLKYQTVKPVMYFSNALPEIPFNNDNMMEPNKFISHLGYNITSISGFAIWEDDCDERRIGNIVNPNLWQVDEICKELLYKKCGVLCNHHIYNVQNITKKDLSYGLFDTFFVHFFKILNNYANALKIGDIDKELLQKNILLRFFTHWMLCWAVKDYRYKFSSEENLEHKIYQAYKRKKYFSMYVTEYERIKQELIYHYREMRSFINRYERIYLYGAGYVASIIYGYVVSLDRDISGFIVTRKSEENFMCGKRIFEVDSFLCNMQTDGILIATGVGSQRDIINLLGNIGYSQNVLAQQIFAMDDKYLIRI